MNELQGQVTELIEAVKDGKDQAWDDLFGLVYDEVKVIALSHLRRESAQNGLQATVLVHEAYLRLVGERKKDWHNRSQFFGALSGIMRRVLVDLARKRHAAKRGGDQQDLSLMTSIRGQESKATNLIHIEEHLQRLETMDKRQGRIVELRVFCGLTMDEIAEVLGVSSRTVKREWRTARAYLRMHL